MDAAKMAAAGISINVSSVLPDAIILDAGATPPTFWIIEAVASDGEISEDRKADLLTWAEEQYIDPEQCQFVSAFSSRNSAPARRRLKDIAVGTYCWFLDEPDRELAWNELPEMPLSHHRPEVTSETDPLDRRRSGHRRYSLESHRTAGSRHEPYDILRGCTPDPSVVSASAHYSRGRRSGLGEGNHRATRPDATRNHERSAVSTSGSGP